MIKRKSVSELSSTEARDFFLKSESYCTFDLPPYFCFDGLLKKVSQLLFNKQLKTFTSTRPREYDNVNYTLLINKDGQLAWRPLQLVHPALYVSLVHQLTSEESWKILLKRFRRFSQNQNIQCLSLPVVSTGKQSDKAEQILTWWEQVEQKSIEPSLDFDYMALADISGCYEQIYTHSLAWAVNGKSKAKKKEFRTDFSLLENQIDGHLQDMNHGQTNGIPQGSVLMDFIAEIVLGYGDMKLSVALKEAGITDYKIIRYRDDYRIFSNHPTETETILKLLSQTLYDLGFKLNPAKTKLTNDIIRDSIKADKMDWITTRQSDRNLQKHLILIHDFVCKHPGSGHVLKVLDSFLKNSRNAKRNLKE